MTNLIDLIFDDPHEAQQEIHRLLLTSGVALDLPAVLGGQVDVLAQLAHAVNQCLATPIGGIAAQAWAAHRRIQHACDATRNDPIATQVITLVDEGFEFTDDIALSIDTDDESYPAGTVTVTLNLTVEAITVTVAQGRVRAVGPGEADAKATLSIADHVCATKELAHIHLPAHTDVENRAVDAGD